MASGSLMPMLRRVAMASVAGMSEAEIEADPTRAMLIMQTAMRAAYAVRTALPEAKVRTGAANA